MNKYNLDYLKNNKIIVYCPEGEPYNKFINYLKSKSENWAFSLDTDSIDSFNPYGTLDGDIGLAVTKSGVYYVFQESEKLLKSEGCTFITSETFFKNLEE